MIYDDVYGRWQFKARKEEAQNPLKKYKGYIAKSKSERITTRKIPSCQRTKHTTTAPESVRRPAIGVTG